MRDRTRFLLGQIGLSPRELEGVDLEPIHQITDRPAGFGVVGTPGVGKTFLLVRRIGQIVEGLVADHHLPAQAKLPFGFARWRNWPDMAEDLKSWVAQDWTADVADLVEELSSCRDLYLDDLGQERIAKADDYSLGLLRLILDNRYRSNLPVFWTSNLAPVELNRVYGARTASRIFSAWPPVALKGPDLRLPRRAVS